MDILIKNMEMPRSCNGCTFDKVTYTPRRIGKDTYSSYEWHECFVKKQDCTNIAKRGGKAKWCPLIPVPEHGRLIDVDAYIKVEMDDYRKHRDEYSIERAETISDVLAVLDKYTPVVLERTT